ncbi:FAD-dependent oxidoreductase [Salipaludibacillus keqinensis]|uniref:FAD-dependent oxidoreductase n=1 Tax=Salipaludibacillus keqinensis TaxID=2045207 RepID=A0A323TGF6_9BACI|nr:FAD-dependent oxidoreductase [Salipaludibacillus keqinensis]PYZ93356.1 FAD-dependent oxidoreductase [Salipaludibacillus keqinensis]
MSNHPISNYPDSLWLSHEENHTFPKLQEDIEVDVAIIGAGVTGITSAYLLSQQGLSVALIEGDQILNGTTGYTTAKVTSQHGAIYHKLIQSVGEENAWLYYEANEDALAFIKETAVKEKIEADLQTENAFIYTANGQQLNILEKEAKAYQKLRIDGIMATGDVGLPFEVDQALLLQNQAQFHPVKFFKGLLPSILKNGGMVFEGTRVQSVKGTKQPTALTTEGYTIKSNHCIVSSHFPFNDLSGLYFSRLHVERSYCLAIKPRADVPKGMSLSIDPGGTSLREAKSPNGEPLLLIGGGGHTAGKNEGSNFSSYESLKQFGEKWFGIESIPYRWSSQDLKTLDFVPYIGQNVAGEERILVATGYGKWGMTNGVAAALLLKDKIIGNDNPYHDLYDPMRSKIKKTDLFHFAKENVDTAKEFIKGKVHTSRKSLQDLNRNEGAVIEHEGKQVGAYKDEDGSSHLVSLNCTHMGCDVEWNDAEISWDCPCHGSRFSHTGKVIEGPATKPLKKFE